MESIMNLSYINQYATQTTQVSEGVAKKYQSKAGGLNDRGRAHFNRQGHNLKKPVSKQQAKKSPKARGRRKSFCSRMGGQKKMHNIDCRKDPDKAICKSLKRWDCHDSFENKLNAILESTPNHEAHIANIQQHTHSPHDEAAEALDRINKAFDDAGIVTHDEEFKALYGKWADMTVFIHPIGDVRLVGVIEPAGYKPAEGHERTNNWVSPVGYSINKREFDPENIQDVHQIRDDQGWSYEDISVIDNR